MTLTPRSRSAYHRPMIENLHRELQALDAADLARNALAARLLREIQAAADALAEATIAVNVPQNVGACVFEGVDTPARTGGGWRLATGEDLASGREVHLVGGPRSPVGGHSLIALRWRPTEEAGVRHGVKLAAGWAAIDLTTERHPDAISALRAALDRPSTARAVAERLRRPQP